MKQFIKRKVQKILNREHNTRNYRNCKVKIKERQQHQHQYYHQEQKVRIKNDVRGLSSFQKGLENRIDLKSNMRQPYERWKYECEQTITSLKSNCYCIYNAINTADIKCMNRFLIHNHNNSHLSDEKSSKCNSSNCIKHSKHYLLQTDSKNQIAINKVNTQIPFKSAIRIRSQNIKNNYYFKVTPKRLNLNINKHLPIIVSPTTKTPAPAPAPASVPARIEKANTLNSSMKSALFTTTSTTTNDKTITDNNDSTSSCSTTINNTSLSTYAVTSLPESYNHTLKNNDHKTKSISATLSTTIKLSPSILYMIILTTMLTLCFCPFGQAIRLSNAITKTSSANKEQLYIGLIAPHTNFGKRDYLRAIHTAVSGLNRTRGAKLTFLKDYQFEPRNIRFDMMSLTPSPTGKYSQQIHFEYSTKIIKNTNSQQTTIIVVRTKSDNCNEFFTTDIP